MSLYDRFWDSYDLIKLRRKLRKIPMHLFDRNVFLTKYWDYEPGQHVTFLGPTSAGKTTLKMQLMHVTEKTFPGKIAIVDLKPRHREMDAWAKRYRWIITPRYPIPYTTRIRNLGYDLDTFVFRPPHSRDLEETDIQLAKSVYRLGVNAYHSKDPWIVDADEMLDWVDLGKAKDAPPMHTFMRVAWTRGRSSDLGFWGGTQRPYDVPLYAYSQPSHLFISRDTDVNNHRRYRDIGGIDPAVVASVVRNLPQYHWLYLRPRKGQACVIGP